MAESTGIAGIDAIAIWAASFTAVAGGLALLWRILRAVIRVANRLDDMWDDWHGVPADPVKGAPGRPGVMYRIGTMEGRLDLVERRLPAA
jgi:hypothetical protein